MMSDNCHQNIFKNKKEPAYAGTENPALTYLGLPL